MSYILVILASMTLMAEEGFEAKKQKMLDRLNQRAEMVSKNIGCVNAATDLESLRECRKAMREMRQERRAARKMKRGKGGAEGGEE